MVVDRQGGKELCACVLAKTQPNYWHTLHLQAVPRPKDGTQGSHMERLHTYLAWAAATTEDTAAMVHMGASACRL